MGSAMATKIRGLSFVLLATLAVVGCEDGRPTSPVAPSPITSPVTDTPVTPPSEPVTDTPVTPPSDFVGRVAIPLNTEGRNDNRPVQGVTVTVFTGPRSGERVQTDHDGRYTIPDFDGDELTIRLEKSGHETKEVIVHRRNPTTLMDGKHLGYDGPQNTPGTVLLGLKWPSGIRSVLRQMPIVADTLFISGNREHNWYGNGVVEVQNKNLNNLRVVAHELCHAHQHYRVVPQGSTDGVPKPAWEASPEGKAYLRARQADWDDPEVGKAPFDLEEGLSSSVEGGSETCARWWDVDRRPKYTRAWLQVNAPNRARWAEEWLTKP